jgi:hypothetical protein
MRIDESEGETPNDNPRGGPVKENDEKEVRRLSYSLSPGFAGERE